ncbi:MAG: hypothetical protein WC516_07900 [Patescibacteria group bacterium]|jgi:hypothetical protein
MSGKCRYCDKELVRKPNEHECAFRNRKYCDKNCVLAHQKEQGHWRNDLYLGRVVYEDGRYS